jgi:hypothetical protein
MQDKFVVGWGEETFLLTRRLQDPFLISAARLVIGSKENPRQVLMRKSFELGSRLVTGS